MGQQIKPSKLVYLRSLFAIFVDFRLKGGTIKLDTYETYKIFITIIYGNIYNISLYIIYVLNDKSID